MAGDPLVVGHGDLLGSSELYWSALGALKVVKGGGFAGEVADYWERKLESGGPDPYLDRFFYCAQGDGEELARAGREILSREPGAGDLKAIWGATKLLVDYAFLYHRLLQG